MAQGWRRGGVGAGLLRASGPEATSPRTAMEIASMCWPVLGLLEGDGRIIPCVEY